MTGERLDPRWEWIETYSLGSASPTFIKGHCRHVEVVPVDSTQGETVAHLCLTCDGQLPAEWVRA